MGDKPLRGFFHFHEEFSDACHGETDTSYHDVLVSPSHVLVTRASCGCGIWSSGEGMLGFCTSVSVRSMQRGEDSHRWSHPLRCLLPTKGRVRSSAMLFCEAGIRRTPSSRLQLKFCVSLTVLGSKIHVLHTVATSPNGVCRPMKIESAVKFGEPRATRSKTLTTKSDPCHTGLRPTMSRKEPQRTAPISEPVYNESVISLSLSTSHYFVIRGVTTPIDTTSICDRLID